MPRKFAFTATEEVGELQLGGFDPESIAEPMELYPMAGFAYGVNITSIKFGDTELLNFAEDHDAYVGEFDSGTTCILLRKCVRVFDCCASVCVCLIAAQVHACV
jgi:hypothetical protein